MEELEELVQQGKEEKETKLPIESEATMKLNLTVDEVIEEYVGSFGFSQLLHVFFVSLAWMFDSQNTLVTIFSDAKPLWTCKGNGSWCDRGLTGSVCGLDPGAWEWVGGKESSTIAEWGLVCDHRFRAGIPASLFFLGSLLGCAIYGRLADSYLGRKKTVLLACLLTSVTTFLTSLSPNVWIYAFFRFTNGFSRSGIGICCLVLSTEVLGRKWRGQVGQYSFFFFTAGFLSLPLLAYPNRTSWRNMYKILSVLPLLYSLLVLPFICESPRWLVIKGRTKEALEVLNKLATLNGKKLPNNLSLSISATTKITEPHLSMDIWSATWATRRMITVMFAGLGVGFVYYGVQLNVENLHFNLYFTVAINAMMEIPAVFVGGVLLSFTNRRLLFSLSAYTAGVSCILCILFFGKNNTSGKGKNEQSGSWPQLIVEAIGFMGAATAFDVLYIYCLELFPTNVRNYAVSLLRQALMLGASMAPLLVVLGRLSPSLSFLIFGVLAIFSGFSSFWLPETRNAPLYETLEQQEEEEEKQTSTSESRLELGKQ